ncbi:MAG: hypothetical protein EOS51_24290 [Mesorhizobium sp.]|uniref:hypothetical protein n=1 Tax=unclassified Mesorhizobium TaxID=325217 RepID=UPI000FE5E405|nr:MULTISPECIES: hypothetical protein [unclassified Mesorhizobium]RWC09526.1 MAG: hypothetical protein EOS51_24290 [Mesorhizobium sp.]TGT93880.1 hypothetical protein EN807_26900 [Mesorhizobium sp. M5C.F.Ca.ET.164.01.1.1]
MPSITKFTSAAAVMALMMVGTPSLAKAEIVGTLTMGIVVDQIFSQLNGTINKAVAEGDYLLARASMEAKDAIEAWRLANTDLINKTFNELNATQREIFAKADALMTQANDHAANRLETIQQIGENANQIIADIPIIGGKTYITRYGPRIVVGGSGETIFTVKGISLGEADPQLTIGTTLVPRISLTQQEAQFALSNLSIPVEERTISRQALKFSYKVKSSNVIRYLFGAKEVVDRDLALIVFPKVLATYDYSTVVRNDVRVDEPYTAALGQFKARNDRVYKVAKPKEGWKWDLEKPLKVLQGHGEAGRCEGTDINKSSESGISVFARLDEIRESKNFFGLVKKDGYVSCSLSGTIYKMVPTENPGPAKKGDIVWHSDLPLDRPDNTVRMTMFVKTFDNRDLTVDGDRSDKLFNAKVSAGHLLVTPKIPDDIAE